MALIAYSLVVSDDMGLCSTRSTTSSTSDSDTCIRVKEYTCTSNNIRSLSLFQQILAVLCGNALTIANHMPNMKTSLDSEIYGTSNTASSFCNVRAADRLNRLIIQ